MDAAFGSPEHFDVLIVGAGISGLGAAHHLQTQCPGKSFVILEALESFGGTWLTHKYPGVRSDSDLYTFGYRFKPWTGTPIATAEEILRYMGEVIDENGLVRHIGTSNMTIPKLRLLLRDARIRPACTEMELHPHFQQPELFRFVLDNHIVPIGYSPIGSPARPDRDRTEGDTVDIEDPVIVKIAERLNVHPAVVCVKWAVQRGQIPIPFSVNRRNYLNNLRAVVTEPLLPEEMHAISKIDRNCRLIKGQVFLWKENQSWEDLWDLNGEIAAP